MPNTPLRSGDPVIYNHVFRGIVGADHDGKDDSLIPVTLDDGTELMLRPSLLRSARGRSSDRAHFAAWMLPFALPIDRAVLAFMGFQSERSAAARDDAILALFLALAPIVASMAEECFQEISKRDFIAKVIGLLRRAGA
jgi:hypothetical protein